MLLSGASGLRSPALSGPFPVFPVDPVSPVAAPPEPFWPVVPVASTPGVGSLSSLPQAASEDAAATAAMMKTASLGIPFMPGL
jgi:hypothetical protein